LQVKSCEAKCTAHQEPNNKNSARLWAKFLWEIRRKSTAVAQSRRSGPNVTTSGPANQTAHRSRSFELRELRTSIVSKVL
jgi:hypothetical protein